MIYLTEVTSFAFYYLNKMNKNIQMSELDKEVAN